MSSFPNVPLDEMHLRPCAKLASEHPQKLSLDSTRKPPARVTSSSSRRYTARSPHHLASVPRRGIDHARHYLPVDEKFWS